MAAPITLSARIGTNRAQIFKALTESRGLASFWTTDSVAEPKEGSVAVLSFGRARLEMKVDELDEAKRVAWTCVNDFPMDPYCWEGTTVTWSLDEQDGDQTTVLLEHGNWPTDLSQSAVASTAFNWALILKALKSYVETGEPQPVFGLADASVA